MASGSRAQPGPVVTVCWPGEEVCLVASRGQRFALRLAASGTFCGGGGQAMKAAVLHAFDGPGSLRWEDVPDPKPAAGEVLVRVRAVGVNRTLDIELTEGTSGWLPTLPHIPGSEPAGEVVALGEGVDDCAVGDRVAAAPAVHCGRCRNCLLGYSNICEFAQGLGRARPGGYAELLAVPTRALINIPPDLSFAEGAAIPQSF